MVVRGKGDRMREWGFVSELSAEPWDAETVEVREDSVTWSPCSVESVGQPRVSKVLHACTKKHFIIDIIY